MDSVQDPRPGRRTSRRDMFRLGSALAGTGATFAVVAPLSRSGQSRATAQQAGVAADMSDRRIRMQHLLRRTGFAPTHEELTAALEKGEAGVVDAILDGDYSDWPRSIHLPGENSERDPADALVQWWLNRLVTSEVPAQEKLTLFWHGWHVSGFPKVGNYEAQHMYKQVRFQREHAVGSFAETLKGISRQPAMLRYLDNDPNTRGSPNENWARELMELFTMGVGNYSEQDVKEAARAFTGYSFDEDGKYTFSKDEYDDGSKTIFGKTGRFDGDDVIDLIVAHDATPGYVARRVWTRFAYPNPEDEVVDALAKAFRESGGTMTAVFKAAWTHEAFYSDKAYRALVKSPVEFAIGAIRQLGLHPDRDDLMHWLGEMGQLPGWPPNVSGWPGGRVWLGTGQFLARLNGVDRLVFEALGAEFDSERWLKKYRLDTPTTMVDFAANLLLDGVITAEARNALLGYAAGDQLPGDFYSKMDDEERDLRVRGTLFLILASPAYHLA